MKENRRKFSMRSLVVVAFFAPPVFALGYFCIARISPPAALIVVPTIVALLIAQFVPPKT
jgi:hypothetical protein